MTTKTATKAAKRKAEPPRRSLLDHVRAGLSAGGEARPRGRVHGLDEPPAPSPEEAAREQAALDARRRAIREARDRRHAAAEERRRPRRAPVATLYPLLHARKEAWTTFAPRDDDRIAPVSLEIAASPELMGSSAMRAVAGPTPAIARRHEARPAAWRAEDVVERLAGLGVTLELAPDGRLAASGPGGHMDVNAAAIISGHHTILTAHLAGAAVPCSWCREPAVVTLVGGALACEAHGPGLVP